MRSIIVNKAVAESMGMLRDGRFFVRTDNNTRMFIPVGMDVRIDLRRMLMTEDRDETEARTNLPPLTELIKDGRIRQETLYREHAVFPELVLGRFTEKEKDRVAKEFAAHGFNVTRKAIDHNYFAWLADCKSGYRDERNGYHLSSPCCCSPLSFRATSLEPELDWQKTYEC